MARITGKSLALDITAIIAVCIAFVILLQYGYIFIGAVAAVIFGVAGICIGGRSMQLG